MKTNRQNSCRRNRGPQRRWVAGGAALLLGAALLALSQSATVRATTPWSATAAADQAQPGASPLADLQPTAREPLLAGVPATSGHPDAATRANHDAAIPDGPSHDDASHDDASHDDADSSLAGRPDDAALVRQRERGADELVWQTIERLTHGGAFEAKLKQRVWAAGREVVGVGRYEQAGGRTGRASMELMIPIAHGKCLIQQTCDGRLAWTREQVGEQVRLRRVDVGRLDELVPPESLGGHGGIAPGLRVGGLVELLERVHADYRLRLVGGHLEGRAVWIAGGKIRPETRQTVLASAAREDWPPLLPTEARIAIAAEDHPQGFGQGLPVRFEFWGEKADGQPSLISLLEVYDARQIAPAPQQHFRFETGGQDVDFTNDTERYLRRFGVHLTDRQRMMLWR